MITERQAKKIKVGDRVEFSDGVKGECIEVGFNACKFSWQDGQIGIIHHRDMQEVSLDHSITTEALDVAQFGKVLHQRNR